jgi:predicted phosphoribosyltransferase
MFKDRKDAGKQLAQALESYQDENVLVLAIPRGGVELGYEVAKALNADFSLIVVRKLPYPENPEAGFGAVAEDGSTFTFDQSVHTLPDETVERIVRQQRDEVERRIEVLRKGKPLPEIEGRTVILVDDGIAMGSTMRAAIALCKHQGAGEIVVASPVSSERVKEEIRQLVDRVVILVTPPFFRAVAQVYQNWYDVSDREVLEIMEKWDREKQPSR